MPRDPSLLDPFDGHIRVEIEGRTIELPADNTLLRLLQYLGVDLYPCRLCWNGDCDNCRFAFLDPNTGEEVVARGCETVVSEGMSITQLPAEAVWPDDEERGPAPAHFKPSK